MVNKPSLLRERLQLRRTPTSISPSQLQQKNLLLELLQPAIWLLQPLQLLLNSQIVQALVPIFKLNSTIKTVHAPHLKPPLAVDTEPVQQERLPNTYANALVDGLEKLAKFLKQSMIKLKMLITKC